MTNRVMGGEVCRPTLIFNYLGNNIKAVRFLFVVFQKK